MVLFGKGVSKISLMSKCDFNKVAKQHFRAAFLKNTSGGLLLRILNVDYLLQKKYLATAMFSVKKSVLVLL